MGALASAPEPLPALFRRFLRYGFLAWGGPVAQIALMHREVVERDGWITEDRFRKTLALYQALPGPEALELAVYFGMVRAGRRGGLLAGLGFMMPGVVFVTALAALYVRYAATSDYGDLLLYGTKPAVIALIAAGFLRLLRASVTTVPLALTAVGAALVAYRFSSISFLIILAVGGLITLASAVARRPRSPAPATAGAWLPWLVVAFPALHAAGLGALALLSLKVGLLTFGGAYTAIPFLHRGAVEEQGWITNEQFLDALALCGLVPAPLVSVGVFIGYQAAALPGAALATLLIFAPAFGFTLVGHRFFERIVGEPRLHAFLLGVTAAVIGLVAAATLPLGRSAIVDAPTALIAVGAFAALISRRVPLPIVLALAALTGLALQRPWAA